MEPAIGGKFAGHRIEGVVGRGGMGVVYRALDVRLQRLIALKLMSPQYAEDREFRQRFERESQLAASLEHPHVIPIYQAGEEEEQLYITMRLVEDGDLKAILEDEGLLSPRRATEILSQAASALDEAHAHGLVHRDVKPANFLIERQGPAEHVYLSDFGLTKRLDSESRMTATGMFVGTVDYVAPEQVEGKAVDARTDTYSLGAVLFHTVTGQVPYPDQEGIAKLYAVGTAPPPAPSEIVPGLPRELDRVVARAMAKDPADRYPSAGALAAAASAAVTGHDLPNREHSVARGAAAPQGQSTRVSARPKPPSPQPPAETLPSPDPSDRRGPDGLRRSRLTALGLGSLAAVTLVVVILFLVVSGDESGESGDPQADQAPGSAAQGDAPEQTADGGAGATNGPVIRSDPANAGVTLEVASHNIEQTVIGEVYSQALAAAGYRVMESDLSGPDALQAQQNGQLDGFPEHVNAALASSFGLSFEQIPTDPASSSGLLAKKLSQRGLLALSPTPFGSSLALAAMRSTAERLGVSTVSELGPVAADLTLLGPFGCDCLDGIQESYGLSFKTAREEIEWDSRFEVLNSSRADLSVVSTIDAPVLARSNRYTVLEDDQNVFPVGNVVFITDSATLAEAGPDYQGTVELVQQVLTDRTVQNLLLQTELRGEPAAAVARRYLEHVGLIR